MNSIFLDTSALAKHFVKEAGTNEVRNYINQANEVIISILTITEFCSVLVRRKSEKLLSSKEYQLLKQGFIDSVSNLSIVSLEEDIIAQAISVMELTNLRTLDAIQVASAIFVKPNLFLTADDRQARAAAKIGLAVIFVGR